MSEKRTFVSVFRFLTVLGIAIFSAVSVSAEIPAKPKMLKAPVVGHRGHSAIAPENTMSAVIQAIKTGANGCEIDVYRTTDGVVVLSHDDNLKRCGGGNVALKTSTLADLQKCDVSYPQKFGDKFKGERVPTMDSVIQVLKKSRKCIPVVEIKQDGIEEDVLKVLQKHNMVKRSIIIAFSANVCKKMRELDKDICIAWLVSRAKEEKQDAFIARIIKTLDDCNINTVDLQHNPVDKALVDTLHEKGITVFCWTVDDAARIQALYEMGVDSVTTNVPDVGKQMLKKAKLPKANKKRR